MRLVILTQDDPFYLAENFDYLLSRIPAHSQVVACVLFEVSPFGKRESIFRKAKKTLDIFGFAFFLRYLYLYSINKINPNKNVKKILHKHNIPIYFMRDNINKPESLEVIKRLEPDLLISIAGNQIFKRPLIDLAPKGCLNLHSALLPKYRGLMPTFWVMKNSERYAGVSVFFVDEGIDSGPIIVQKKVEIGDRSLEELIKLTKQVGMDAIIEAIDLINLEEYTLIENDPSKQSYFSFPTRNDVIEFKKSGKRFF